MAGSTAEASKERGEPNHAADLGGASIWYRWTAPLAGTATFSTRGTGFDTLLAAYSGTIVLALRALDSNDDISAADTTSTISLRVTAGQMVYIAIDGSRNSTTGLPPTGATLLTWSLAAAPSNDNVATAQNIGNASGAVRGSNANATLEAGEDSPLGASTLAVASVWYAWTAPATGSAAFVTTGSSLDTVLGVYLDADAGLQLVGSNDDNGALVTSSVSFNAIEGNVYYISVDSALTPPTSPRGSILLSWSLQAAEARIKKAPPSVRRSQAEPQPPVRATLQPAAWAER